MTQGIVEEVVFELRAGVAEAEFLRAAEAVNRWAVRQPGFEYRCLTKSADGRWFDLRFWSGADAAERAARALARDAAGAAFLSLVAPGSVATARRPVMARKAPAGLMLAA